MGILETNKQFYDNMLLNPSPLFQFVGSAGKTINDAFKAPVDAVKKEADQLKKEGAKAYANKKVEQAKAVINAVNTANQTIKKDPRKALETTGKFIADNAKGAVKSVVNNPAAAAGNVVGEAALMALPVGGIGKGAAKALPKTTLKTMTPVTSSMGGDAIKGSITNAKHLGFPAKIAEEMGGLPEQANRNIQAALLKEARNNPIDATFNNAYGLTMFNPKTVSIAKNAPDKLSTGEHEAWHALVRNVEDMQDATGYTDPRYLKFSNEVMQAIGQPVGRLSNSETLAYAIEKLQNPNYVPNWGVINSEGVSKQQFDNLIKTMQPRYNRFLFDRRHK